MTNRRPPLLPYERWLRAGVALVVFSVLLFVGLVEPRGRWPYPDLPCGMRMVTGLPCPLCGGTRATHALLCGNVQKAWHLNPLAWPAVIALLAAGGILTIEALRGRSLTDWPAFCKAGRRLLPFACLALAAWWLFHAFTALRDANPDLVDLENPIALRLREWLKGF